MPLQSTYSSAAPATIIVECNESKGEGGGLDAYVKLTALKVGSQQ